MTDVFAVVSGTIAPQLEQALADSRANPLPASPSSLPAEPGHSAQLFARLLGAAIDAAPAPAPSHAHADTDTDTDTDTDGRSTTTTTAEDPAAATVTELLAAYRAGTTTPDAVLAALAPHWTADDAIWSDAVLRLVDGAAAAAAESTRRWAAGEARPLEGIPFAVKDIIDVAGTVVTSGSLQTGDRVAPADATVVARLRAAGAIPVFTAATTEFACGGPHNARYGAVRNPWDPERWTGGSSTGSGSALAARIVPLALGSDTGGSIRVPSALCGTTGIKPTYGLVPRTGVASLSWTLDHVGPMARSAEDLALVLAVIAGGDGADPTSSTAVPLIEAAPERVEGLRIGVPRTWFTDRVDAAVLDAHADAVDRFRTLGATVVPIEFDDLEAIDAECWTVFYGELAANQEANAATADLFDAGTRARFDVAFTPTAADYLRALRRRPLVQAAMVARMDEAGVDVVLTPGIGATAPRLDDLTMSVDGQRFNLHDVVPRNTRLFDYVGFPALMMPAGTAPDGLPVGLQLVARPWDDRLVLSAAAAFQAVTDHHRRVPPASATRGSTDQ
ncbi:aspartyl/glutamyl-tRNA(Asn/Gln) amidotransferase subunit A [Curtobacterium flaccumfaciens]|uniref:Aspartyl/glutamyl-tRNA(Asn/Gln) amidotransferase subunit A n=1 Tax=Curtobacterium flaccumfaciens TaxID=2035 RepID=A0A4R6DCK0_9MICO|nr:amidase [Curtobacterium flaccumfaciens]TDN42235.1 aspartyl/glutamyl-tRNA(Asn/Gln) amidotransferase subunit A [Curtobacterium flaccumfaciens]